MCKEITGIWALRDPFINQGTAFSKEARERLKLRGLLPPKIQTIELQAKRVMERIKGLEAPLDKYIVLDALRYRNRTLYFYVLHQNIDELMPIIYTPTVGKACVEYDHIFTNTSGLYVTLDDKGKVQEIVDNCYLDDVEIIVITDGERVLGLGDLGTGAMGIPKGKLALYTVCAGIFPEKCLPVMIDVGTNNAALINDPLYLGIQHSRIGGEPYFDLIREFIDAAKKRWPKALIQFEDFGNQNAFKLLDLWQDKINCFNDDIQGTAAVALAGLYSAVRAKGTELKDEKILFFGAGEAALGIADLVTAAIEEQGIPAEEARKRIFLFDSQGLVTKERPELSSHKALYAQDEPQCSTFLEAVESIKPTAIIGVASQAGAFNAYVLGTMARINEKPIIFSLSNPTAKSECTARDAYFYTLGKCLFASGSPFAPVEYEGKTFIPRQGNNCYVFPGIGLGTTAVNAKLLPTGVFLAAAKALAATVTEEDLAAGSLYPSLTRVRDFSVQVAKAVAEFCRSAGLAEDTESDLDALLRSKMYLPQYPAE